MVTDFFKLLKRLLKQAVETLDYEFVGLEYVPKHTSTLLRIFIDKPGGVNITDCVSATHQIKGVLGVEESLQGFNYELEVSSPGIERPLFEVEHFQRYIGREVMVKLRQLTNERRQIKGLITEVKGSLISIKEGEDTYTIDHNNIKKAHLITQ